MVVAVVAHDQKLVDVLHVQIRDLGKSKEERARVQEDQELAKLPGSLFEVVSVSLGPTTLAFGCLRPLCKEEALSKGNRPAAAPVWARPGALLRLLVARAGGSSILRL